MQLKSNLLYYGHLYFSQEFLLHIHSAMKNIPPIHASAFTEKKICLGEFEY